jgi:hypothetical protein
LVSTFIAAWFFPPVDQLILDGTGSVIDTKSGLRLVPSKGRRFHPSLAKFAADGRLVVGCGQYSQAIIDTVTDKQIDRSKGGVPLYRAGMGFTWVDILPFQRETFIGRLPVLGSDPDRIASPATRSSRCR